MTGDIIPYLLQKGYATDAQITAALASPLPLRNALIAAGVASVSIAEAWAAETKTPFVDLSKFNPEQNALKSISSDTARKFRIVPIKRDGNNLYIAVIEESDALASRRILSRETQCKVICVIADPEQIRAAIARYYGEIA